MAHRAAASGCALDPVPVLILRGDSQHTSVTFAGRRDGSAPPRVCLAPDLMDIDTDPADRAWTTAHELSHALRYQWRPPSRLPSSARMLIVCCVVIAVALAAAVRSSLVNDGAHLGASSCSAGLRCSCGGWCTRRWSVARSRQPTNWRRRCLVSPHRHPCATATPPRRLAAGSSADLRVDPSPSRATPPRQRRRPMIQLCSRSCPCPPAARLATACAPRCRIGG